MATSEEILDSVIGDGSPEVSSEEAEKKEVKTETAVEEYQRLLKAKEDLLADKEKLENDVFKLREGKRHLLGLNPENAGTAQTEPSVATASEPTKPSEPKLDTQEGWVNLIEKKSGEAKDAVLSEVSKIRETQKSKALREFLKRHPEYVDESKFKPFLGTYTRVKSRNDYDAEEILEDLEDAWAVENRRQLTERERELGRARTEAEVGLADVAASGFSPSSERSSPVQGATASDQRMAREIGMPIEKYMKYKSQLDDMEVR